MATQISREICDVMSKRSIGPMQTAEAWRHDKVRAMSDLPQKDTQQCKETRLGI